MNIFMQHWYWNKYPTLFNFFFFKFKVVKAIKHFFLKYALYIFNEQIISKLHCSRIKYHRCIMNNLNNNKGAKNTNYSVSVQSWKQMKRNVNNLLMCFFFKGNKYLLNTTFEWQNLELFCHTDIQPASFEQN